ncbi:serine/threonine-protein kinase PCRK1-like [Quercus lobata]|uniref:serine/threonine-protein kinase PCRK1-like n=1 Tax=Quercus lobata TaxID=97700 RepID=UPI001248E7FB|nr:serine/threonine-protein kinase PCRK1-like [Quercus lobata]
MEQSPGHLLIQFNVSDLEKATKGFKPSYKIGEGDFGAFYKGIIKLSGKRTHVLIQQIQGHVLKAKSDHSWVKELNTIAAMKHQNLVNLIGYCLSEGVRFAGSLSWGKRLVVVQDAARALAYLHEHQIVLSLSSSSIVVDNDLKGKLFDLPSSRLDTSPDLTVARKKLQVEEEACKSAESSSEGYQKQAEEQAKLLREANAELKKTQEQFVKTEKQNSLGAGKFDWNFMDYHTTPEFDPLNNLTSADNVYGFGVILLEIVTNKPVFDDNRPKNERNLVEWVKTAISGDQSKLEQIIDPMSALWVKESAMGVLALSSKCIEEDPNHRPSMSKILKELAPIVEEHSIRVKEFLEKERQEEIQVQMDAVICEILLRNGSEFSTASSAIKSFAILSQRQSNLREFTFSELKAATKNFRLERVGLVVYKGL